MILYSVCLSLCLTYSLSVMSLRSILHWGKWCCSVSPTTVVEVSSVIIAALLVVLGGTSVTETMAVTVRRLVWTVPWGGRRTNFQIRTCPGLVVVIPGFVLQLVRPKLRFSRPRGCSICSVVTPWIFIPYSSVFSGCGGGVSMWLGWRTRTFFWDTWQTPG